MAASSSGDSRRCAAAGVAFFALVFAALAVRRPGALTHPTFWGDDATWFREQLMWGWRAVPRVYAGYWQLAPRLIALAASLAPLSRIPFVYALSSVAISAGCCSMFASRHFRPLLASDALRAALCLVAACGIYSDEMVANPTNLQWYLLLAGTLLLLQPPEAHGARSAAWAGFGALIAACNPLVVVPLLVSLVARGVQRRGPAALQTGVAVGVGVQLWIANAAGNNAAPLQPLRMALAIPGALKLWFYRVLLPLALGHPFADSLMPRIALVFALVAGLFAVFALAVVAWTARPELRAKVLLASAIIIGEILLPLALRGRWEAFGAGAQHVLREERYFFVPACATAYLLALAIERAVPFGESARALTLLLLCGCGFFGNARVGPLLDMHWQEHWREVRAWRDAWREHGQPPFVMIPISPDPWSLMLPGELGNRGFEDDSIRWRIEPGGTAQRTLEAAHSGLASLKTWTFAGGDILVHRAIAVEAGRDYSLSVWTQRACGEPRSRARIFILDANASGFVESRASEPCGRWENLQLGFRGRESRFVELYLVCEACDRGSLWDDLSLVPR